MVSSLYTEYGVNYEWLYNENCCAREDAMACSNGWQLKKGGGECARYDDSVYGTGFSNTPYYYSCEAPPKGHDKY